jgi:hypothetical protein
MVELGLAVLVVRIICWSFDLDVVAYDQGFRSFVAADRLSPIKDHPLLGLRQR